jgi:hypothetical protein
MILVGKTNKGKNVVQRDGAEWSIIRTETNCICFNGQPGTFIEPVTGDKARASRWIQFPFDPDFELL